MPFEHTASKPEDAPMTVWLPSFRIRNLGAGQDESFAEMCPQNGGRGLPDGKNLVFLYLCAPNSTQLARIRESCSAPRALRRRIGKKSGFLYLKRGFLHTGSCVSCHQAKKTAPQIQKRQILASR